MVHGGIARSCRIRYQFKQVEIVSALVRSQQQGPRLVELHSHDSFVVGDEVGDNTVQAVIDVDVVSFADPANDKKKKYNGNMFCHSKKIIVCHTSGCPKR